MRGNLGVGNPIEKVNFMSTVR